jgi:hypothetical protein
MVKNIHALLVLRLQNRFIATSLHFFAILVLLSSFSMSPAFAQNTYSDSWLSGDHYSGTEIDYGEDNTAYPVVAGCGVTEGSYMHEYYVDTKLTSPSGRLATNQSWPGLESSRVDLELPWDSNDLGDYTTQTDHYSSCNICEACEQGFHFIGTTFAAVPVGVSFTCFEYVRTIREFQGRDGTWKRTVLYRITNPCNASCKADTATYTYPWTQSGDAILLSAEPFVGIPPYNVCSRVAALLPKSGTCNGCSDVMAPIP